MDEKLTLKVGGRIYDGWKDVGINTSISQIAGSYALGLTERWPGQSTSWEIQPGEFCELAIGGETVITGYVDVTSVSYDARSHDIKVTGRDQTGDLVDCSAPSKVYSGQTFGRLAQMLCEPYGITVYDETVLGPKLTAQERELGQAPVRPAKPRVERIVPKFSVQNGESVFRTLEKLARSEGVLLVSDGEGGLLITRAGMGGYSPVILENGVNILRASYENSYSQLYSEITVKGQAAAPGASKYTLTESAPKGHVKRGINVQSGNSQVGRFRPLILLAETQANAARCQQRAEWESSSREAKSRKVTITVQGWRERPGGRLWRQNRMVKVRCPWMRMDEWWLIDSVSRRLGEDGTLSDLVMVDKRAYDLLPEIPKPAGGGSGSSGGKYGVI